MVSVRIALRYLFSKKSHNAVNVISFVSMAGVAVATIAIICVLSVFNGFADLAYSRISLIDPQLKVVPSHGKYIYDADSVAASLLSVSGVVHAAPTVEEQALAMYAGRQMPVKLRGVSPDYSLITSVDSAIIDGRFYLGDSTEVPAAVASVGTAMRLSVYPGSIDAFALYVPRRRGNINPASPIAAFRTDSMYLSGVYEVNQSDHDAETVIVSIAEARYLLDMDKEATSIDIALEPSADESAVTRNIVRQLGPGYSVLNRLQQEEESLRMISIEKWITFLMLAFILLIASFNVISTLSMLIIEKADNMVTLSSLGAAPSMIRSIFMYEGWLITLIGGILGLALGVLLCIMQQIFGFIRLGGDVSRLSVTAYPVRVDMFDVLLVAVLLIFIGYIISYITSRFAVRTEN